MEPNETLVSPVTIMLLGAAVGAAFGWIASRSNFCTMGAVSDVVNFGDWTRMRQWFLAVATAVLGVGILVAFGWFDPAYSFYTLPRLSLSGAIVGGLLFGVGMTLASGCTSKNLVRLGGGNLKAVVVLIFLALAAIAAMKGALVPLHQGLSELWVVALPTRQDLGSMLAAATGWAAPTATLLAALAVSAALAGLAWWPRGERAPQVWWGLPIGLCVVAGWVVTAVIGYVPEHPETLEPAFIGTRSGRAESLSMVAPYADLVELFAYAQLISRPWTFGLGVVVGMAVGAWLEALQRGRVRIELFVDGADFVRHAIGAILMGFGGVLAIGCTIGQALSGVSTLAIGSFVVWAAIVAGAAVTMKVQYWWMMRAA